MSYTLSNCLVDCLSQIGKMKIRTATGGGTTTAVDSTMSALGLDDDSYIGNYLFVISTTDGEAPIGEYKKITDFVSSTGTFTTAAFSAAIGAGDMFGYVTSSDYELAQLVRLVNLGLSQLGDLLLVDTTTLDTASNQTEYPASLAWKRNKPVRIDLQTRLSDSNDNRWVETTAWEWIPSAPGDTGLIVFREQPATGYDVRIWYEGVHPELDSYDDIISETIHPNLARVSAIERILFWKNAEKQGSDTNIKEMYNWASQQLQIEMQNKKTWKHKRASKGLSISYDGGWRDKIQPPDPA